LHNKIIHKSEFGHVHCVDLTKRSPTNFSLPFLDIPTSFDKFWKLLIFLGLNKSKNEFLIRAQYQARSSPGLQCTRHGGLPCTAGQKASWALAWRPGPAEKRPVERYGARVPGVLAARSPCATHVHDGVVAHSPVAWWQLTGGKVLSMSTRGPQGGCRARRLEVELTRAATRHGGGGGCFCRRPSSAGRELQWLVAMEAQPYSVGAVEGR
jgi:hypothetical protein